ncbi:hypothetical protein PISMIDRAFT_120753 [Pisolithus microcarpus 441]|uniref:Uncharacterized protein n=1 Tax=Pisolithus microcarpus 441 TaxID=765257 RepID=A0A0C9YQC2_9AGAM|nr:hypothetical protein PISMIDRAFT_120753 [Pisolithus microcarpus 441]
MANKYSCSHLLCRKQKDANAAQFPKDRNYTYCESTSNWSLHAHVKRYHLDLYLAEAQKNTWSIYLENVKEAFKAGYNHSTLRQALSMPNVMIRTLPPLSQSCHVDPSMASQLESGLPPFSLAAMHRYLVRFIVTDDQVSLQCYRCCP